MADVNANIGVGIDTSDALSQLKNLQRQISQFHTAVAKSSETAAASQRNLQKNFLNSINSIEGFSAELRTVKTTSESFTTSLEKNKFSIKEYFRYAAGASKSFGKSFTSEFATIEKVAIERVKNLQTQYIKMGRDANGAMQAIAVRPLTLDMGNLATKTAIAAEKQVLFNQLLKQGSTNLLNFGKNTQWAGRQLMVGFTLPLATLGITAARTFMEMEAAVLKFRKVYGDLFTTQEDTDKALEGIKAVALEYTKYGVAIKDTIGIAADAAAAGFKGVDLQNQTTAATKLAVLGQIEQGKALETTIALQNAFAISTSDLAGTIDFLNAVENQTVVSLDDITTAIPKVAPVIRQLGGDVKDLSFFMAAMKEGGINASEGANALKSGLAALINPTGKASEMLAAYGINVRGIVDANQGDLAGTVVTFAKALDQLAPLDRARAIEQLFGKFQFARLSALFTNVAKDGTQAARVLELAGSSVSSLASLSEKELGQTAASSMNKFKASVEQLNAALAPVGEQFLKIATPFVDFAKIVLEGFNKLPDGIKSAVMTTIGVVGGLAPIFIMVFGLLANGLANAINFFRIMRIGFLKLTGQASGAAEATQYMTTEQQNAAAAAASLEQSHSRLAQQFTVETTAVNLLKAAYEQAAAAGARFAMMNPGQMRPGRKAPGFAKGGVVSGPGNGTSDSIAAMVSNGEAIIPADKAKKYAPLISAIISGKIPGFAEGTVNVGGDAMNVQSRTQSSRDAIQKLIDRSLGQIDDVLKAALTALAQDTKITVVKFKEEVRKASQEMGRPVGPEFSQSRSDVRTKTYNASGAGIKQSVQEQLTTERPGSGALELEKARAEANAIVKVLTEFGATAEQIQQAVQIDRAHVVDVQNEQKKLGEAWSSDLWVAQSGAINNGIGNSLASSERNRKVYIEALQKIGATETQIASMTDKATRNISVTGTEFELQGAALRQIAEMAKNGELTAKDVSKNFVMYATAVGEGQVAGQAVLNNAPEDLAAGVNRTVEELDRGIKRIAQAMPEAAVRGFAKGAKSEADIASPSKVTEQIGRDTVAGQVNALKDGIDDVKVASKDLAAAITQPITQASKSGTSFGNVGAKAPVTAVGNAPREVVAAMAESSKVGSTLASDIKASFANVRTNLSTELGWVKEQFADVVQKIKSSFTRGGQEVVASVQASNNQLIINGKKAGFDYIAEMKGRDGAVAAVITKKNQEIISGVLKTYNDGIPQIRAVVLKGVEAQKEAFRFAGASIADEIAKGSIARSKAAAATTGAVGPAAMAKTPVNIIAGTQKALDKIDNFGNKAMQTGFALSTLTGIMSTFGGTVGEISTGLFTFTSVLTALATVTNLLVTAKTKELILAGAARAQTAMGRIADAGGMMVGKGGATGLKAVGQNIGRLFTAALGGPIGKVAGMFLRFVPILGIALTAFAAFQFLSKIIQDQKDKISGLGDVSFLTAEKMKKAGELLSFEAKSLSLSGQIGAPTGVATKEISKAQEIRASEDFKTEDKGFGKEIKAIKDASLAEAQSALNSMMMQLIASGASPEAAQALVTAIATEAGKTKVDLSFAMKIDPADPESFKNIDTATAAAKTKIDAAFKDYTPKIRYDRTGTGTDTGVTDEMKQTAAAVGGEISSAFSLLKSGFDSGTVGAQQFTDQLFLMTNSLDNMDPAALSLVLTKLQTDLDQDGLLKGLTDVEDKLMMMKVLMEGQFIDNADVKALEKASKAGASDKDLKAAVVVRARYNKLLDESAKLRQADTDKKKADAAVTADKVAYDAAIAAMEAEEIALNNKIAAYDILAKSGVPTADAIKMVSDATFLAGLTADITAEKQQELIDKWYELQKLAKKLPKESTSGGGGAKEADPYKEGLASLKKQRLELNATRSSFLLLNKTEKDSAKALELATNPELLALMAKGVRAGSKQWRDMVAAIRAVQLAQETLNNASLTGRTEQFNQVYDKVSAIFEAESAILQASSAATESANQKLIDSLEAQIETYNRSSDVFEKNLDAISIKEDAINKTYDDRIKALDSVKKVNQDIINQQKSQLSIADALSQGDVSAAAKAMQESRAQNAGAQGDIATNALEAARTSQLAAVTAGGFTRIQNEAKIKDIKDAIAAIETGSLRDAQAALKATQDKLISDEANLKVQGKSKLEWDDLKLKLDAAQASASLYEKDVLKALKNAKDLVTEWNKLNTVVVTKHKIDTTYTSTGTAPTTATPSEASSALNKISTKGLKSLTSNEKKLLKLAKGGYVSSALAQPEIAMGTDSVPAMLTPGEYVVKADTVSKYGQNFLDALNAGKISKFAKGGAVGKPKTKEDATANKWWASKPKSGAPLDAWYEAGKKAGLNQKEQSKIITDKQKLGKKESLVDKKGRALRGLLANTTTSGFIADIAMKTLEGKGNTKSDMASLLMAGALGKYGIGKALPKSLNFMSDQVSFGNLGKSFSAFKSGSKTIPQLSKIASQAGKFEDVSKNANEMFALEEYIKRPMTAHLPTFKWNKEQIMNLANTKKIPAGTQSYRALSEYDVAAMKDLKVGQSYTLDSIRSITDDVQEAARIAHGEIITGGQGQKAMAKIEFMSDTPGLKRVNDSLPNGKKIGFDTEGLMVPGTNLKLLNKDFDGSLWNYNFAAYANGGMVNPKMLAKGGPAVGTDTVPSLLTPGEFVVNKAATAKFQPLLSAINSGGFSSVGSDMSSRYTKAAAEYMPRTMNHEITTMPERSYFPNDTMPISGGREQASAQVDNSVYNYNLSVSVEGSNASADQIANVVMNKLRNVRSQQVRGQVVR